MTVGVEGEGSVTMAAGNDSGARAPGSSRGRGGGRGRTIRIVATAALVLLAVALFFTVYKWHFVYHHATQELGIDNASSRAYNFWSGIMGGIPTLAFLGGAFAVYRAHNCHVIGCYRVKRRVTPQGNALCHVHSAMPLEQLSLPEVHQDHVA